jgi:hypothetical protein
MSLDGTAQVLRAWLVVARGKAGISSAKPVHAL